MDWKKSKAATKGGTGTELDEEKTNKTLKFCTK